MPSPECLVKDGAGPWVATTNGVDVTPGNTITIKLSDSSVKIWDLRCFSTDELGNANDITESLDIDPLAKTATFVAPVKGRALLFYSLVERGISNQTQQPSFATTFGIYTRVNGRRVGGIGETTEGGIFGWGKSHNELVRTAGIAPTDNSDVEQTVDEKLTSNATPVTIGDPFEIPTDSVVSVSVQLESIQKGPVKSKSFDLRRRFINDGGVVTAGAPVEFVPPEVLPSGSMATGVSITNTGTTGRVEVTGLAGVDVRWVLYKQRVNVTAPGAGEEEPPPEEFDALSTDATVISYVDSSQVTVDTGPTPDVITAVTNLAGGAAVLVVPPGNEPNPGTANPDYDGEDTIDVGTTQGFTIDDHGLTTGPFWMLFVANGGDGVWFQDANGNYLLSAGGGSGDKLQVRADGATLVPGDVVAKDVPGVWLVQYNGASSKVWQSKLTPITVNPGTNADLTDVLLGICGPTGFAGSGMAGSVREHMLGSGIISDAAAEYLLNGFGAKHGLTIGA